jgi:hypothetical protein
MSNVDVTLNTEVQAVLSTLGAAPPADRVLELEKLVDADSAGAS